MDTIFMNSENSRTSEPHVLILKLTDKLDLRRRQRSIALSNLSIYCTWKKVKSSYNYSKFKISAATWNDKFELPDRSYSLSDIQDHFEYILKTHSGKIDNPSTRIYVKKIENRKIWNQNRVFIILSFQQLSLDCLETLKIKQLKIKIVKMYHIKKL